jgi:hypothetical protein
LDFHRAIHGLHHAAEFGQNIVPRRIYHSAALLLKKLANDVTIGLQRLNGMTFVFTHETAVALHIGA